MPSVFGMVFRMAEGVLECFGKLLNIFAFFKNVIGEADLHGHVCSLSITRVGGSVFVCCTKFKQEAEMGFTFLISASNLWSQLSLHIRQADSLAV